MDDPLNPRNFANPNSLLALSPVNYSAWQEGYMPPSEHVLIHNLIYEDAKVMTSLSLDGFGFWVVTRGGIPTGKRAKLFVKMIESQLDDLTADMAEEAAKEPVEVGWSI